MVSRASTILLIGRPGSGKGTQAKLLSEKLGWIKVSSGDQIRTVRDGNEPFSPRVREMYDRGALLPDWFADYLLERALLPLDSHVGVVCEGFGRTKKQAEHFMDINSWLSRDVLVVHLEVSEEEVRNRMLLRAETENRPDSSTDEKIDIRLAAFNEHTVPALEYFRTLDVVVNVNGAQNKEEVRDSIAQAISS